jgi:hypothetical protein
MSPTSPSQRAHLAVIRGCVIVLTLGAVAQLPDAAPAQEPQPPVVETNTDYVEAVARRTSLAVEPRCEQAVFTFRRAGMAVLRRNRNDRSGSKAAVEDRSAPLRHSPQHPGKQTIQERTGLALECQKRA